MSEAKPMNLVTEIIDQHLESIRARYAGKLFAFTAVCGKDAVGIGAAIANEPGYCPVAAGPMFGGYSNASNIANELNERMGLNHMAAIQIVCSSMKAWRAA